VDSSAVRSARYRAHKRGDHSVCLLRNCPEGRKESGTPPEGSSATITPDVPQTEHSDPSAELKELAARLASAHRADPGNALLARELRMTLQALIGGGKGKPADDELEDLFAELRA
jgi:hypothetical protein